MRFSRTTYYCSMLSVGCSILAIACADGGKEPPSHRVQPRAPAGSSTLPDPASIPAIDTNVVTSTFPVCGRWQAASRTSRFALAVLVTVTIVAVLGLVHKSDAGYSLFECAHGPPPL